MRTARTTGEFGTTNCYLTLSQSVSGGAIPENPTKPIRARIGRSIGREAAPGRFAPQAQPAEIADAAEARYGFRRRKRQVGNNNCERGIMSSATRTVSGPFFDDLEVGLVADSAPALTLTEGVAAAHAAIVGDRMRLALDAELSRHVIGSALAHPALVWDVANGQSTLFTQRVIANLFYRGLMFRRAPSIGDTLYTKTEVVGLRQNRPRPGRAATGLAALRVRTVDQKGRAVLDYTRCAMLPLRDREGQTGHNADLETIGEELDARALHAPIEGWNLKAFRDAAPGLHFADLVPGT